MNALRFRHRAFGLLATVAMLTGCGGSQPPIDTPRTTPQTLPPATHADRGKSWMLPEAKGNTLLYVSGGCDGLCVFSYPSGKAKDARAGDLLYVATGGDVYVLSYPSGKVVGRLGVAGANSLCSDKAGNVFVVQGAYESVSEYSHRGKLLQTLPTYDVPQSCSIDPTTGNLAVPTVDYSCVYIYPGAQPPAQSVCNDEFVIVGLCAYDSQGNLFLDGAAGGGPHHSYRPGLAELPKGSATFNNYLLSGSRFRDQDYDSVNWDGTYVTLSNPSTHSIYRVQISHKVKIVGRTRVPGWVGGFCCNVGGQQTWLKDGKFIAQRGSNPQLAVWSYPNGGKPTMVLPPFASAGTSVDGVVLSPAPH